jgi:hypothetical protein
MMEKIYDREEICRGCGEVFNVKEMVLVEYGDEDYDGYYCQNCAKELLIVCPVCEKIVPKAEMITDVYGNSLCLECAYKYRDFCNGCGTWHYAGTVKKYKILSTGGISDLNICKDCETKLVAVKCRRCGKEYYYHVNKYAKYENIRDIIKTGLCDECFTKMKAIDDKDFLKWLIEIYDLQKIMQAIKTILEDIDPVKLKWLGKFFMQLSENPLLIEKVLNELRND